MSHRLLPNLLLCALLVASVLVISERHGEGGGYRPYDSEEPWYKRNGPLDYEASRLDPFATRYETLQARSVPFDHALDKALSIVGVAQARGRYGHGYAYGYHYRPYGYGNYYLGMAGVVADAQRLATLSGQPVDVVIG